MWEKMKIPTIRETYLLLEAIKKDKKRMEMKLKELSKFDISEIDEDYYLVQELLEETKEKHKILEAYFASLN